MIGDVYTLATVGKIQGQTWVNTFAYEIISQTGTDPETRDTLVSLFAEAFEAPYENALPTSATVEKVTIKKVLPVPAGPGIDYPLGWSGERAGAAVPSEVAAVIKRSTDTAGPKGRGRIYVPGALSTDFEQTTGLWVALYKDLLDEIAASMLTSLQLEFVVEANPVLWSQTTLTARTLQRVGVNDAPRVQRRRQPGRGI